MNDVRRAIEGVGGRFDPPGGGFDDLSRRRNRARTRRRIAVGAFALALAAGGSLLAARALLTPTPPSNRKIEVAATWPAASSSAGAAATAPTGQPECPEPTGDSPPQVVLSTASGPAGSSVRVSGAFTTGQLWLQLWWNADGDAPETLDPPPWPPSGPDIQFEPAGLGPVVNVATVRGPTETGDCSYQTRFTVPDVAPGTYQLATVFGTAAYPEGQNAYALLVGTVTFDVTA